MPGELLRNGCPYFVPSTEVYSGQSRGVYEGFCLDRRAEGVFTVGLLPSWTAAPQDIIATDSIPPPEYIDGAATVFHWLGGGAGGVKAVVVSGSKNAPSKPREYHVHAVAVVRVAFGPVYLIPFGHCRIYEICRLPQFSPSVRRLSVAPTETFLSRTLERYSSCSRFLLSWMQWKRGTTRPGCEEYTVDLTCTP